MRYYVIEETFTSLECGEYIGYGIELRRGDDVVLRISDIYTDKDSIHKLCALCNDLKLSEIHFMDVVEDYLA